MNMVIMSAPIIVIFIIVAGTLALAALLFKSPQETAAKMLKVLGLLVIVAVVVGMIALSIFLPLVGIRKAPASAPALSAGSQLTGSMWAKGIEEEFAADVYASPQAAAFGLGKHLELNASPREILIADGPASGELLSEFRRGLQNRYDTAAVRIAALPDVPPQEDQLYITLDEKEQNSKNIGYGSAIGPDQTQTHTLASVNRYGTLEVAVQTAGDKHFQSVGFESHPWLRDYAEFASLNPGGRWLVVGSESTASTPLEARQQALEHAWGLIGQQIRDTRIPSPFTLEVLEQHGFIVDEFSQQLRGLSGPIWRHALLLEVSPQRAAALAQQTQQAARTTQMSWAKLIGSFAGMIAIIFVVYAFLNAATKGYYAGRLGIFSALLAMGLGVIIWLLSC
jgi:hypothetical protein